MGSPAAGRPCDPPDDAIGPRPEGQEEPAAPPGTPPACIAPFQVRLPKITVHLGRIVVRLPKARIRVFIPLVDGQLQVPSAKELEELVANAPWTPVETVVTPSTTAVGPVDVQGLPITTTILPVCVQVDLRLLRLATRLDPPATQVPGRPSPERRRGGEATVPVAEPSDGRG